MLDTKDFYRQTVQEDENFNESRKQQLESLQNSRRVFKTNQASILLEMGTSEVN